MNMMNKMNIRQIWYFVLSAAVPVAAGCSPEQVCDAGESLQRQEVRLNVVPMAGAASSGNDAMESSVADILAFLTEDGILREIILPVPDGVSGRYMLETMGKSGTLHFAANLGDAGALAGLEPGITAERDLLLLEASAEEMTSGALAMTGRADLKDMISGHAEVRMVRSVARIDVSSAVKGVKVLSVSVGGIVSGGKIFPSDEAAGQFQDGRVFKDFSSSPLENGRHVLCYVPEQRGGNILAEALVSADGGLVRLEARLPETISRNHVYDIAVRGNGADISLEVTAGDWESGDSAETAPDLRGLVDIDASVLPAGVTVNASRDTVSVHHYGAEFVLVLLAEPSAQIHADGHVDGVSVERLPDGRDALADAAAFSVTARRRIPGAGDGKIHLEVTDGNVNTGRVVLMFKANPVNLDGILELDGSGRCDFGRYVEGELAEITFPSGMKVSVEFPEGEPAWMKIDGMPDAPENVTGGGRLRCRLLAGWKPNDPEADGRIQNGMLVISSSDGSMREEYHLSRVNWGLPVVRIGGNWWTKYNLRGDSSSFGDQITCGRDPSSGTSLADMLASMPDDELLSLMGDQYQGGNAAGLPLRHDGTSFHHEGMQSYGQDFGVLDPVAHVPEGYRLPSYGDFAFFAASDDYNLGGTGSRSFINRQGETLEVRIIERDVDFLGHNYGTVAFYEFGHEGSVWVLYGLGHQWNADHGNIARMQILLATAGDKGMSWLMEGYAAADRPGQNWLKFTPQNSIKTRTLRCIKSPVEYIYE